MFSGFSGLKDEERVDSIDVVGDFAAGLARRPKWSSPVFEGYGSISIS